MSDTLVRRFSLLGLTALAALLAVLPATAQAPFPTVIDLPAGFQPEGIAIGRGDTFFVGSIPTGAVYSGSLRTGEGSVLVPPQPGRAAIGVAVDNLNRLFVAGGPTGDAYVYDGNSGDEIAHYNFTDGASFINDVALTNDGAWFTDSQDDVLYRIPIAPNGDLAANFETLQLSGDFQLAPGFNLNGIDATPNGKTLFVVQSGTGLLFTVDPETGVTNEIDLGGESVPNGDGILLHGKTLYVVQNQLNLVARIDLSPDFSSGVVVSRSTDPSFSVPTTVDRFGDTLYFVNARFGTPDPDTAEFWLTSIPRP